MRVHLYEGGLTSLVAHSGVGQAICHQRAMLAQAGVEQADGWRGRADAVHINTVLPDAPLAALRARLRGETVVWYGHSTMEDFRESFVGSNRLAPLFRRWLCFCYGLADVVVTPTPYSRRILEGYGLKKPVYALSNGVDTEFFAPDPTRGAAWRARWQQRPGQKGQQNAGGHGGQGDGQQQHDGHNRQDRLQGLLPFFLQFSSIQCSRSFPGPPGGAWGRFRRAASDFLLLYRNSREKDTGNSKWCAVRLVSDI